jgi:ABC-type sugar transport system ATPase subunit
MSMVFQSYALYPHKTVFENIAYPLRVRKTDKAALASAVQRVADLLELGPLLERRPRQLSGGEAQRVAVARALVWQPRICLMDEPLSNLDALLRLRTRIELKRLHAELGQTFVFVTHDQEEAMSLGTQLAVMRGGKLVQLATPHEIYHRPATRFVAEFIGKPPANTLDGELRDGAFRAGELVVPLRAPLPARLPSAGPVVLAIRPEQVEWVEPGAADALAMTVRVVDSVPPDCILSLARGDRSLLARTSTASAPARAGDTVHVRFPSTALTFFAHDTGQRLD